MSEPRSTVELARALHISDKALAKLRYHYRQDHGEKAEARLLAWLRATYEKTRDRRHLLGSKTGYTELRSHAIKVSTRDEDGKHQDEPEAVDPSEIADLRSSREAKQRFQAERAEEAGDLFAAMSELRAVLDAMPQERKRRISKTVWMLRSRLDSAEREMRRRMAA